MPGVLEGLAALAAMVNGRRIPVEVGDDIRRLIAEAHVDNDLASEILRDLSYSEKREAVFELVEVPATVISTTGWTVLVDVPALKFNPRSIWLWVRYTAGSATVPNFRLSVYDRSGRAQPRVCQVANASIGTGAGITTMELPVPDNAVGLRLEAMFTVARTVYLQCTIKPFRSSAWR
jgi:hypothetical protein